MPTLMPSNPILIAFTAVGRKLYITANVRTAFTGFERTIAIGGQS